jgi:hypothetical protein
VSSNACSQIVDLGESGWDWQHASLQLITAVKRFMGQVPRGKVLIEVRTNMGYTDNDRSSLFTFFY